MDSAIAQLEKIYKNHRLDFDSQRQRQRCHAHIIHLAAMCVLDLLQKVPTKKDIKTQGQNATDSNKNKEEGEKDKQDESQGSCVLAVRTMAHDDSL
jgi:hypothetical protein